jgi:hypothetical protein
MYATWHLPKKRQQMMLAEAVHVQVPHDDHLVVRHREQRAVDQFVDVGRVTARQELKRISHAARRLEQPFACGVFAQPRQELPDKVLHVSILAVNRRSGNQYL